jgi:hypothetical protein
VSQRVTAAGRPLPNQLWFPHSARSCPDSRCARAGSGSARASEAWPGAAGTSQKLGILCAAARRHPSLEASCRHSVFSACLLE